MQYVPFASDIEIPFYASLASQKINHDKLDDSPRSIFGLYEIRPADVREHSCRMQIRGNALTSNEVPTGAYSCEGTIKNVNTIEDYRNLDKMAMLKEAAKKIWDAINDASIYDRPSLLASFLVISYADLKKYRFSYWFAFPALVMDPPWTPITNTGGAQNFHKKLEIVEAAALIDAVQAWRATVDSCQHGFFLAKKNRRLPPKTASIDELEDLDRPMTPQTRAAVAPKLTYTWQISPLSGYDQGFFEGQYSDDCYVAFADPSNYTEESGSVAPGWMLRNLLVLIRQKWQRDRVQILCYRETQQRKDVSRSVIFDLQISNNKQQHRTSQPRDRSNSSLTTSSATAAAAAEDPGQQQQEEVPDPLALPKVVGWEKNAQGKPAGRFTNLTDYMDPKKLADSSVDLNLKLMKWRISPNLDLDRIKNTKCLLLGAGTLGSYVSRNLLGWGVRTITFVDNAGVSFSNPVRQPLFNFEDCLEGGKRKAVRAAEALRQIYPGVEATGHVMSVPMAGHPVTDPERSRAEYEKLRELIKEHDAIFLLMDSRESRWLPTVMGKAEGKIVMNAALGFDTYVVMRHGIKPPSVSSTDPTTMDNDKKTATELGCYFCNDVVAPVDSMKDLTLDQQCTVTRPGIAAIASAMLVEILVSVLQHPLGAAAPAPTTNTAAQPDRDEHPLGLVPHQIRGFLSNFTNINVVGRSYDCCSACSDRVLDAYRQEGWGFVEKALNEKGYVEELSGLKEVQRLAEMAAAEMDFDDDDGEGFEDEGDGDGELI